MNKIILFTFVLFLAACNTNDITFGSSKTPSNVSVVFPKVAAISTSESVKVRVKADQGVTNVKVNGIAAENVDYLTRSFWQAEIPLQFGHNLIQTSYEYLGSAYNQDFHSIRREPIYIPDIRFVVPNQTDNSTFILDSRSNAVYKLSEDNSIQLIKQFHVSDSPSEADDDSTVETSQPEAMVVSDDGTLLYYAAELEGDDYIMSLDLVDGTQTILYGPDSPEYSSFNGKNEVPIVLLPSKGEAGSLVIAQYREAPLVFDLSTKQLTPIAMPSLNDISSKSSDYRGLFSLSDTELLVIAEASNRHPIEDELFHFTIDLVSCEGKDQSCVLSVSNYAIDPTLNDDCRNPGKYADNLYLHPNKAHVIISDDPTSCYLDLATNSMHSLYQHLDDVEAEDFDAVHLSQNRLLAVKDTGGMNQFILTDDFINTDADPLFVGADLIIGESSVAAKTGREVVIDDANHRLFYLERYDSDANKSQVYIWNLLKGSWAKLGDYPATGFEIAMYNAANDRIYVYNDSSSNDDELFEINPEDGSYQVVISATEKAVLYEGDFNVDSVALNEKEQLVYLATRVNGEKLSEGQGSFSLMSYNLATKVIKEISPPNDNAENKDIYPSYDMSYDEANRRVLFYKSSGENAIWAVDVDNGERSIFTDQKSFYGPDTSNARGQVIDPENNRLILASQDSQSLFSADLDTGLRTMLSPAAIENGIFFNQIIGVDLFESEASAYVADEGLDAIYQVDLISGERVLIHNPQ